MNASPRSLILIRAVYANAFLATSVPFPRALVHLPSRYPVHPPHAPPSSLFSSATRPRADSLFSIHSLNARKALRGRSRGSSGDHADHPMPVLFPSSFHRLSRLNHFSVSTPSQKPTLTTATTTTTGASIGGGDVVGDKSVVNILFRCSRFLPPPPPRQNHLVESHVWSLAASPPFSHTPCFIPVL